MTGLEFEIAENERDRQLTVWRLDVCRCLSTLAYKIPKYTAELERTDARLAQLRGATSNPGARMPNTKPSTPTVDQYFDQLSQLAESTGAHVYLAVVHARASTRHLESAMKTQEDLTAEIEKAKQVIGDRVAKDQATIDQDKATIDTLTKTVEDLKAHPAAADLTPQIDSIEQLLASLQGQSSDTSNVTSDSPANDATGSISSIGL